MDCFKKKQGERCAHPVSVLLIALFPLVSRSRVPLDNRAILNTSMTNIQ